MASVTYGKDIMASVIMAKILWQMKLSPFVYTIKCSFQNKVLGIAVIALFNQPQFFNIFKEDCNLK